MSTLYDFFYNAATGNLSPDQLAAIQQQEAAALVQAGATPNDAAAQAQSDATIALSTYEGQGGLGLSWTGALPSQPGFGATAEATASSAVKWLESHWIVLVGAAIAILLLLAWSYGGFR